MTAGHAHVPPRDDGEGERGLQRLSGCDGTCFLVVQEQGEVDGKSPLRRPAGHLAQVTIRLLGDGQGDLGGGDIDCVRDGDQLA